MAIVTSLAELDTALQIARKHGVTQIRIGDIEVLLGLPPDAKTEIKPDLDREMPKDIDAEAHLAYKNL